MDTSTWSQVVIIVVAVISATGSVIAAAVARRTQTATRPLGNGFAHEVVRRLERIEGLVTEHLQDHSQHDLTRRRRQD